ncbi:MAG: ChbG/HpnK family deacetylase [Sphingomonas sp.]|uniref:ChbG/HpnK family deacetylase n=1 Tax=Sphingomonas sp. TaxID=28214 RepID=UPI001AD0E04D|nr:ChbG/HpnK family deacetylase [Sphingomonas sp.]MBN8816200.1 ChbG/HpnK family deacetylase [Sphingomonas sp.]
MPRLILCSDDFAFSRDVTETIAGLARYGKLNAIGCMTAMPNWRADSRLLNGLPDHVQIGLHLTLTGERPLTAMPRLTPDGVLPTIETLRRSARRGMLPLGEIVAEVVAQFDSFIAAMGRPPAFIDGHQHAHALPDIREIVLAQTARLAPGAWVRNCADRPWGILARPFVGKAIGSAYHSRGLRAAAASHGLACNDGFAGHYDFASDYRDIFPRFLRRPGKMHVVMCHPGAGQRPGDTIAAAREREAEALRNLPIADIAAAAGLAFPT